MVGSRICFPHARQAHVSLPMKIGVFKSKAKVNSK